MPENMDVNDFARFLSTVEGGAVNLSIAQIKEVLSKTRMKIKKEIGIDIYCLIRLIKQ